MSNDATYQVTVNYPSGTTQDVHRAAELDQLAGSLPAGTYTWTVQKSNAAGTAASRARKFIVASGATPFVVPDGDTLLSARAREAASARPARRRDDRRR